MDAENRKKSSRGKGYPFIPLAKALERAEEFYNAEGRHTVPATSAFKAWNYADKSSGARQTLAALNYFGLAEYERKGQVRLTDLALNILLDRIDGSPERMRLIQEAAMKPAVHKGIRKKYGHSMPSNATVQTHLEKDLHYSERSAKEVISEYKDTIRFANLDGSDKMPPLDEDESPSPSPIKPGDFVQWVSQEMEQFPEPKRVVKIDDKEGVPFVIVEGSGTGIPIEQAVVMETQATESGKKVNQIQNRNQPDLMVDRFTMTEGVAIFQWPERLSQESYDDLEAWLQIELRKVKRSIVD